MIGQHLVTIPTHIVEYFISCSGRGLDRCMNRVSSSLDQVEARQEQGLI